MTPDKYREQRFAELERQWQAGVFPALIMVLAEAGHNGWPLPAWALEPAVENLEWAYWNKKGNQRLPGRRGSAGPAKLLKSRYLARTRFVKAEFELCRRYLTIGGTRKAAFERAAEGTMVTWDRVEKDYNRVLHALREGRGIEYGFSPEEAIRTERVSKKASKANRPRPRKKSRAKK